MGARATGRRRFAVALSFPGEERAFVREVAERLAQGLGRERVFYDEWYEAELVGASGDLKLMRYYRAESEMVVPFFSEHYEKPWCQLEWHSIRAILKERRTEDAVVPVQLDATEIEGWESIDFAVRRKGRTGSEIADVLIEAYRHRHAEAERAEVAPVQFTAEALLAAYRESVRTAHNRPPGLFVEHIRDLDTVFVELELGAEHPQGAREPGKTTGLTLRELMLRTAGTAGTAGAAPRWVVLGDPGAGKSTLARHLCWELAGEATGPLPVYAQLPVLAADRRHPFDAAEAELEGAAQRVRGEGLGEVLQRLAEQPGGVWLLLDGLDEVAPEQLPWVRRQLTQWAAALERVTIAVFSRPVGFKPLGTPYGARARIQALDAAKQRLLLERWLGDEAQADQVFEHMRSSPGLRDACRVPLILSLLAFLVKSAPDDKQSAPRNKLQLYDWSLRVLLERGHGERGGLGNPDYARVILMRLSYQLQTGQAESWTREVLDEVLLELREQDIDVDRRLRSWRDGTAFLQDVADRSGVLAPHDGPRAPWRFLHRQFRELLTAQALRAEGGDGALLAKAKSLRDAEVPRWAEVLGFGCELADEPLRVLQALGEANQDLALRVLPELEGVDCIEALSVLRPKGDWDGDFLAPLLDRWIEQGGLDRDKAIGWLWQQVRADRSTDELAYFHYALVHLGEVVDRERFFSSCDRWPAGGPPEPELVEIPAGEFMMGSPENEQDRWDDEGPAHLVSVSAFELGPTPITLEQYRGFDPAHPYESFDGKLSEEQALRCPVVSVSWWSAYLYCEWCGGELPTEAQWEYACRAGTKDSQYGELDDIAWHAGNSGFQLHPVGEKRPNEFGLCDILGNVSEWCADCFGEYSDDSQTDPSGPEKGSGRVYRGGSWVVDPGAVRPASRDGYSPGFSVDDLGFRLSRGQKESSPQAAEPQAAGARGSARKA